MKIKCPTNLGQCLPKNFGANMIEQYRNITIVGSPVDEGARTQIEKCAEVAYKVALLPDHHKGYVCP